MDKKVDLHTHTCFSDGHFSPQELLTNAKACGIDTLSITDHDTVNGIREALKYSKQLGVEIIPGLEISSDIRDREVHILAYFIDIDNAELEHYLSFFREERVKRAHRIVHKLNSLGMTISIEDVFEKAKNSAIGRPHIAQAMLELGLVNNYYEAFNKYIGNGCPAFEKKVHVSPQSAFKIINDAGGLSFIAHPGNMPEIIIKELIEDGVDGIEVIHPSHSPQLMHYYRGIVNQYYLLESGGSDFHGGKREDDKNLGKYFTSHSKLDEMRKRLIRNSA
ncbi:MAG: PHP domain-containing protein [Ignavibacteriales bacterium]|nr:MAG: PHP domain-containing protein [Ignavibacteriales bacterium]